MGTKIKPVACVNLVSTLDSLEIIQIDERSGEIQHSASVPLTMGAGDQGLRQLPDNESLKEILQRLYSAAGIPFSTPTTLVLPGFFTREVDFPSDLSKEELRMTLVSEAERFYVFKKVEPTVEWVQLSPSSLLYTAFPKQEIDAFIDVFKELKVPVTAIDLNYLSILRGLVVSGAMGDDFTPADQWCLMVITETLFFAALMEGTTIQKTLEAPLSYSEGSEEDVIADIQQDFEQFAGYTLLEKSFIILNTKRLNGQTLSDRLSFQGQVILIEQSANMVRSLGNSAAPLPCTLEAIGGAFLSRFRNLPAVNFLPVSSSNMAEILEFRQKLTKILWIANGVALLVGFAVWGVMSLIIMSKEGQIREMNEITQKATNSQNIQDVKLKQYAQKVQQKNIKLNDLIVKVGVLIPNEAWLKELKIGKDKENKNYAIELTGGALIPEPVNQLRNGLANSLQMTDLEVGKVDMATSPTGQSYYDWSILNKAAMPEQQAEGGQ